MPARARARALAPLLAALPSVAVLGGFIVVPPDIRQVVSVLSVSAVAIAVACVVLLGDKIARMHAALVTASVFGAMLAGIAAAGGYWSFADRHLLAIHYEGAVTYYVLPLSPSPETQQIVEAHGGDYAQALTASDDGAHLGELIGAENRSALAIMATLLIAAQLLLGLGLAGGMRLLFGDPTTDPNG
jgi:hypothetical protein